jgi:hypothetical protein
LFHLTKSDQLERMKHRHGAASELVQVVTMEALEFLDFRYPIRQRGADLGTNGVKGFHDEIASAKAGESMRESSPAFTRFSPAPRAGSAYL